MSGDAPPPSPPPSVPPGAAGTPTPAPGPVPEDLPLTPEPAVEPAAASAPPVTAAPPAPPPAPRLPALPSIARRVLVGVGITVALLLLLVIVPLQVIARLNALSGAGFSLSLPNSDIVLYGVAVALLYGLRAAFRPSRAFGPLTIAASGVSVLYLLYLARHATFSVTGGDVGIQLGAGPFFMLLAIVPLFGVLSGIVTSVEDFARPGERLSYEYPAYA